MHSFPLLGFTQILQVEREREITVNASTGFQLEIEIWSGGTVIKLLCSILPTSQIFEKLEIGSGTHINHQKKIFFLKSTMSTSPRFPLSWQNFDTLAFFPSKNAALNPHVDNFHSYWMLIRPQLSHNYTMLNITGFSWINFYLTFGGFCRNRLLRVEADLKRNQLQSVFYVAGILGISNLKRILRYFCSMVPERLLSPYWPQLCHMWARIPQYSTILTFATLWRMWKEIGSKY